MKKSKRKKEIYSIDRVKKLIQSESIVLPAWQREFVWKLNQIEKIFDSIFNEYPIGNILIWETKQNSDVFYRFVNNIKYIDSKNSESNLNPINSSSKSSKKVSAILDGQQRITSIMNVLVYDNITKNNKHISLYFNAKNCTFKFFEENIVNSNKVKKRNNPTEFDFKVKDIFDNNIKLKPLDAKYRDRIIQLYNNLKSFSFSYNSYSGELKNALEVFRRLNTGGSPLTNPEINVSIIINKAKDYRINFRDEINRKITDLSDKYNIKLNLAFFIKSIVVCILNEVKYDENKVDKYIEKILDNYVNVFDAIEKVCSYCNKVLNMSYVIKSNNVLIPLVYYYYLYKTFGQGLSKAIKYYISLSLIFGYFGGQSDNVISQMIKYIDTYRTNSFDIKNLKKIEIKHVQMSVNKGTISKMLEHEYREEATSVILYLIYSSISPQFVYTSNLVQDHMHPKMNFDKLKIEPNNKLYDNLIKAGLSKKDINTIVKNRLWNKIPNIQLITDSKNGIEGKWKKQFEEWILEDQNNRIDATMPKYTKSSYKLKNFISFYKNRQRILKDIIKNELC